MRELLQREWRWRTWGTNFLIAAAAGAAGLSAQDAEAQFRKSCMSCHTIGAGDKVGPDLKGLPERRSKDWVMNFVQTPGSMIERGDATATELLKKFNNVKMPDLGITAPEADALFKFIDECSKTGKKIGSAGINRPATPQEIANGKALFTGSARFAKGAPSCLSCHAAGDAGLLGGGRLGPDLTNVAGKMGKGLASAIENPAFPTMVGPFKNRNLTEMEAFQVAAYLQTVSGQPGAKKDVIFPLIGIVGVVGGLSLGASLGRNRFKGVRKFLEPKR
jgi:mono/diheme cytochrome c family protein